MSYEIKNPKKENRGFVIKIIIAILFSVWLLVSTSCDTLKDFTKEKSQTTEKTNTETITRRKGDTVRYEVPVVRYKDTTVYKSNEKGTTLKIIYDKNGNVSNADCFASQFEEIRRENREVQQSIKDKDKHKEVKQNFDWLIYAMIGFVFVVCFALVLGFIYIKQQTAFLKPPI